MNLEQADCPRGFFVLKESLSNEFVTLYSEIRIGEEGPDNSGNTPGMLPIVTRLSTILQQRH